MSRDFTTDDIKKVNQWFLINGEYYLPKMTRGKPEFVKQDKAEIEKLIKFAAEIANKLKNDLDRVAVLKEAILKMSLPEIKALYDLLFHSKCQYKARTREGHCVDMKIGNFILPLIHGE